MLPLTRNTTYTPASAVRSADLNDLQDAIVGAKHGLLTIPVAIFAFVNIGVGATPVTVTHSIVSGIAADLVAAGTPLEAALALNGLPVGTRIVNVRVYIKDVAGQPAVQASVRGGNRAGSSAGDAVTAASSAAGAAQTLTLANVNHDVGITDLGAAYLFLQTFTNATGTYSVYAVEIDLQKTA